MNGCEGEREPKIENTIFYFPWVYSAELFSSPWGATPGAYRRESQFPPLGLRERVRFGILWVTWTSQEDLVLQQKSTQKSHYIHSWIQNPLKCFKMHLNGVLGHPIPHWLILDLFFQTNRTDRDTQSPRVESPTQVKARPNYYPDKNQGSSDVLCGAWTLEVALHTTILWWKYHKQTHLLKRLIQTTFWSFPFKVEA